MEGIEVVVAHAERATLRVGDVFLKVDTDQARIDAEVEAMRLAPVPTPRVLWRKPPVLAIAAVPGVALGRLGEPSTASPAAWAAAGAVIRELHDAPLPPRVAPSTDELAADLATECAWLVGHGFDPSSPGCEFDVLRAAAARLGHRIPGRDHRGQHQHGEHCQ